MEPSARTKELVTVIITKPGQTEVSERLMHMSPAVHRNSQHPDSYLLIGEFTRERVGAFLGSIPFEHRVLAGFNHPELPFPIHQPEWMT